MFRSKLVFSSAMVLFIGACAWVKPLPESHVVALLTPKDVVNCVKKGVTHSKTLSKIVFFPRMSPKIETELVTLAKNEAAIMGGDAVVAESELEAGAQVYGVYQCRQK